MEMIKSMKKKKRCLTERFGKFEMKLDSEKKMAGRISENGLSCMTQESERSVWTRNGKLSVRLSSEERGLGDCLISEHFRVDLTTAGEVMHSLFNVTSLPSLSNITRIQYLSPHHFLFKKNRHTEGEKNNRERNI
jgi:hypothetical protein